MAEKRALSKRILTSLYYKQKLSTFQIAEKFNLTAGTIINYMKEYNIKRRRSGPKRIKISKRTLYLLYIKKGLSSRKIAKICHCEQTAILNRLRYFNIPIKQPKEKINIAKEELRQLYTEQKLSTYKIAKKFHCVSGTIYRNLKIYRIETRPRKIVNIPKNNLQNLYINKKYPLSKIAKFYNCCPITILDKMEKYKIPRRSISEAGTKHIKHNFSGNLEEKSYLIGFRSGDLGVRKESNLIKIGCGTTKLDQVNLIKKLFNPYGPIWLSKKDKRGAVHIDCLVNSSFRFLLPKYKSIPKWILSKNSLFFNFLAGYTDAEGSIGIYAKRAKFRIRSYDKKILYQFYIKLKKNGIGSIFTLESKAHIDKRGVSQNGDCWGLTVNERTALLKLFKNLEPLLKHKRRKKDLQRGKGNIILRLGK